MSQVAKGSGRPNRREREAWSAPVPLGSGWRVQYAKEAGEEFTHYRLLPPPNACPEGRPRDLPRLSTIDTLRVLPWLQRLFGSADGPRLFRPVVCGEPGGVDAVERQVGAVDRQARVWTEREHP